MSNNIVNFEKIRKRRAAEEQAQRGAALKEMTAAFNKLCGTEGARSRIEIDPKLAEWKPGEHVNRLSHDVWAIKRILENPPPELMSAVAGAGRVIAEKLGIALKEYERRERRRQAAARERVVHGVTPVCTAELRRAERQLRMLKIRVERTYEALPEALFPGEQVRLEDEGA